MIRTEAINRGGRVVAVFFVRPCAGMSFEAAAEAQFAMNNPGVKTWNLIFRATNH